jgi:hypothetical protein
LLRPTAGGETCVRSVPGRGERCASDFYQERRSGGATRPRKRALWHFRGGVGTCTPCEWKIERSIASFCARRAGESRASSSPRSFVSVRAACAPCPFWSETGQSRTTPGAAAGGRVGGKAGSRARVRGWRCSSGSRLGRDVPPPPPPPPHTKWTRLVPPSVQIGHVSSLPPYKLDTPGPICTGRMGEVAGGGVKKGPVRRASAWPCRWRGTRRGASRSRGARAAAVAAATHRVPRVPSRSAARAAAHPAPRRSTPGVNEGSARGVGPAREGARRAGRGGGAWLPSSSRGGFVKLFVEQSGFVKRGLLNKKLISRLSECRRASPRARGRRRRQCSSSSAPSRCPEAARAGAAARGTHGAVGRGARGGARGGRGARAGGAGGAGRGGAGRNRVGCK